MFSNTKNLKVKFISLEGGIYVFGFRKIASIARKIHPDTKIYFVPTSNYYSITSFLLPSKNSTFSNLDATAVAKQVSDADLICFSSMTPSAPCVEKIAKIIKQINPKAFLLWGGIHCIIYPDQAIKHVDAICIGEGEKSFEIFFQAFSQKQNFKNTPSMWFKTKSKIKKNKILPLCTSEELNSFPHPYIGLDCQIYNISKKSFYQFTYKDYIKYNGLTYRVMWTVGCPFSCTYCGNESFVRLDPHYRQIRYPSSEYMISEIEAGLKMYPFVNSISFFDDNFIAVPIKTMKELFKKYKKRVNLPHYIQGIHPNLVTQEKIELIGQSGANRMRMGIQSGSEKILAFYQRPTSIKNIKKGANILIKTSLKYKMICPSFDIISDNPLEKKEDIIQTLNLLYSFKRPYTLTLFSLRVFPNTPLADYFNNNPDIDISYQKSSYLETRKTLTNIAFYVLATFKPPKFIFNWIIANIKDYDKDQESSKIIYFIAKFSFLSSRALRHLIKTDFSIMAGSWVYYLWRLRLIKKNSSAL
ncbi:MAG: cobalamin-dependent protein [Candidatus Daviesbacteria bacterium]|nr:cobalamin-dependent protein [Candidatus Daviesbacteria bacterium]